MTQDELDPIVEVEDPETGRRHDVRIRPPVGRDPGRPGREHIEPRPEHPRHHAQAVEPEPEEIGEGERQRIRAVLRRDRGE